MIAGQDGDRAVGDPRNDLINIGLSSQGGIHLEVCVEVLQFAISESNVMGTRLGSDRNAALTRFPKQTDAASRTDVLAMDRMTGLLG